MKVFATEQSTSQTSFFFPIDDQHHLEIIVSSGKRFRVTAEIRLSGFKKQPEINYAEVEIPNGTLLKLREAAWAIRSDPVLEDLLQARLEGAKQLHPVQEPPANKNVDDDLLQIPGTGHV